MPHGVQPCRTEAADQVRSSIQTMGNKVKRLRALRRPDVASKSVVRRKPTLLSSTISVVRLLTSSNFVGCCTNSTMCAS
jgi:hypothetical protein